MYIYEKQLKPCKKSKKRLKWPISMMLRWAVGSRVLKALKTTNRQVESLQRVREKVPTNFDLSS